MQDGDDVGALQSEESVKGKGPRRGQSHPLPPQHGKGQVGGAGRDMGWQLRWEPEERGLGDRLSALLQWTAARLGGPHGGQRLLPEG